MNAGVAEVALDVTLRSPAPEWLARLPLASQLAALRQTRLRGIAVTFSPYERHQGEQLRALRNQPHNKLNLAQDSDITAEQQRAWEDGYFSRPNDLCWILRSTADEFAGAVSLYDIDATAAETGRLVIREEVARSSPIIAECELMVQWLAFSWLGLPRIVARIQPANAKMIAMHQRLGFRPAGTSSIRGVPYRQFEIPAAHFHPEPHLRVLHHWKNRPPAGARTTVP